MSESALSVGLAVGGPTGEAVGNAVRTISLGDSLTTVLVVGDLVKFREEGLLVGLPGGLTHSPNDFDHAFIQSSSALGFSSTRLGWKSGTLQYISYGNFRHSHMKLPTSTMSPAVYLWLGS